MIHRFTFFVVLTALMAISAFAQTSLKIGAPAPVFSAASVDGTQYDLAALRGSVVVITFWSTRCAICHTEMPKLNNIVGRHDPRKVVFLALTMENEQQIAGYLQRNHFRFNVLPNSFGVVLQYADRTKAGHLDMGFPSHYVIDRNGLVQYRSSGWDKTEALDAAITRLAAN